MIIYSVLLDYRWWLCASLFYDFEISKYKKKYNPNKKEQAGKGRNKGKNVKHKKTMAYIFKAYICCVSGCANTGGIQKRRIS